MYTKKGKLHTITVSLPSILPTVSPAVLLVLEGTLTSEQLLNLTCTASGNPVPSVAWVFNDTILTSRETYITYGDTDTLPNNTAIVELNTEGSTAVEEYICVATTMYNDTTFSDQDSLYLRASENSIYRHFICLQ